MVTKQDIVAGLRQMGLVQGDIVMLHSSLSSMGQVDGGAKTVVDAFLDALGAAGTLVVPTFGSLGVVSDAVKTDPRSVSSIHPKAGVAAIGKKAPDICRDHWKAEMAHAEDTPYTRIAELGGYVCLLGVDHDRNTTLHTVEEMLRLPYMSPIDATFDTPEGKVTKSWPYFPGPHRNFIGLDRMFAASGKMRVGKIGSAVVRLIKSADLIALALDAGRRDPAFVLCDNPNCQDCVTQRGALRRDRFSREAFKLACAASLAGRYVPEMVENLQAAGITRVELDAVQGKPIRMMGAAAVSAAVEELRRWGVEVSALRSATISDLGDSLLQLAADCRVGRVVLPLGGPADRLASQARAKGVSLSFANADLDSQTASAMLMDLKAKSLSAGFTFSGTGFASAGENPFLKSYKAKLRRFVDQLDVVDANFDGTSQRLGQGNAEVKEMISILRCASFGGYMVLAGQNRLVGALSDAVRGFEHLLETM
jgi:aminoglycoside 3-N-acetyltransferase